MADAPQPRRRRKLRPTLVDVACAAQVSVASVSRFINAPRSVSQAMGERIAAALGETGFRPRRSSAASGPGRAAQARTAPRLVAVLTLGMLTARAMMAMPVFPWLFSGIERAIAAVRSTLVYCHYGGSGPLPEVLLRGPLDGVLVLGRLAHMPDLLRQRLRGQPSVWMMREHSDPDCSIDHVFYDNALVGRIAAEHFLGLGLRRLAFINDEPGHSAFLQRRDCFLAAARAGGAHAAAFEVGAGGLADLSAALAAALRASPAPAGLFLPSDDQLTRVYGLLARLGIAPGARLRLIGCNHDRALIARLAPPPATIDLHLDLIGERAVAQLLARLDHPASPPLQLFVTPTLVAPGG
jgi:DNA-binding LacI/PurR family transcriptional regulator